MRTMGCCPGAPPHFKNRHDLVSSAPPCCHPSHACMRSFSCNSCYVPSSRYFQAGGSPENVIQLLSENYTAVAQTVNLLAEWLIQTGAVWVAPVPAGHHPLSPFKNKHLSIITMLINWKGSLFSWFLRRK